MTIRMLIILGLATVLLSGCGRKGPLELPEGTAPPEQNKPFALDPLIKSDKTK